jgi:hypothetical protein
LTLLSELGRKTMSDVRDQQKVESSIKELAYSIEMLSTHAGRGDSFATVYDALERVFEATGHTYAAAIARDRAVSANKRERKRSSKY